jgi:hypothetical protein
MKAGRAAFYAGDAFRGAVDEAAFPALAPVLDGARRAMTARHFSQALRGLGGKYPHRTADFAADLPALSAPDAGARGAAQEFGARGAAFQGGGCHAAAPAHAGGATLLALSVLARVVCPRRRRRMNTPI